MDHFPEPYECVLFDGEKGYIYLSPQMQPLSYVHQHTECMNTMSAVNHFGVTEFLVKSPSGRYAVQTEEVGEFGIRIMAQCITPAAARYRYQNATKLVSPENSGLFEKLENY